LAAPDALEVDAALAERGARTVEARPGVGLGDDPPNRQPSDALEQVIGSLRAEPVGGREALVELPEVGEPGKRRQLVDHHLGLGPG
jgi:hypothetical protein